MVVTEPCARADAVEERHVEIENRGVGMELVDELDRSQPVRRRSDHGELPLVFDEGSKVLEERLPDRRQQQFARGGDAAAEHEALRVEHR